MPTLIDRPVEGNSKGRKKVFERTSAIRKKANELLSTSLHSTGASQLKRQDQIHQIRPYHVKLKPGKLHLLSLRISLHI